MTSALLGGRACLRLHGLHGEGEAVAPFSSAVIEPHALQICAVGPGKEVCINMCIYNSCP